MFVRSVAEETYCLKTQAHVSYSNGRYRICYRCGMTLGRVHDKPLGSLLDY
jgi:hypothetical protein